MIGAEQRPDGPLSRIGFAVIIAVVVLDQVSKLVADAALAYGEPVRLLPVLSFLRVDNTGIALSLFADSPAPLALIMIAVTAAVLVVWVRSRDGGRAAAVGYALIVGGALGNLADRLRLGHVVDFLFLHAGDVPLFVFNLADVALTCGPAILLVVYLWPRATAPEED